MDDILGTSATNTSDLVLLAYVFLLLPGMIIGFFFARRKMFVPYHKFVMTGVTLVNWGLIAFVMLASYSYSVAPDLPGNLNQLYALVATGHLITGALAQAFATYLIVLMWTERTRFEGILPPALRIRSIKNPMRVTLGLWITTVVLGLGLYFTWYVGTEDPSNLAAPVATEQVGPGGTEDANANLALTEDANGNLALTEDASANLALTEAVQPCPVVTEAVRGDDDDDDGPPPAVTESAFPCSAATEDMTPPAATEAVTSRPAVTESVDDDDDRGRGRSEDGTFKDDDDKDDDDNSGKGSSNSGSSNSGSSNSGKGSDDDDD